VSGDDYRCAAVHHLPHEARPIAAAAVAKLLRRDERALPAGAVQIDPPGLDAQDALLSVVEAA